MNRREGGGGIAICGIGEVKDAVTVAVEECFCVCVCEIRVKVARRKWRCDEVEEEARVWTV